MRSIALEEHFLTTSFVKATEGRHAAIPPSQVIIQQKLLDLGEGRIASMDAGGVDLQVLSLAANGLDQLDTATATSLVHDINDELAAAIAAYPARYAGFASLDMKNPEEAAKELQRCVAYLGFKGAMLDGTTDGEFLDQPKFSPVFEAAQALDVPIYLHPATPPSPVMAAYYSGLPRDAAFLLSIAGWGWHSETALHTLRLIVSGLFERLPKLQLIIGHMGEGIPFALARSNNVLSSAMKHLPLSLTEYFLRNVHLTTSGYFTPPPFKCALDVVGIDRMMYSIDYPFSTNEQGQAFLAATGLPPHKLELLAYKNAESLLKL